MMVRSDVNVACGPPRGARQRVLSAFSGVGGCLEVGAGGAPAILSAERRP
jgi:hypothetical protein